ncbi:hypothetical protein YPPY34_2862 [Yersinia pestis PY-34]|nr:hypothetical protein YPPY06_2885 [Yersinia pestis PY-06]EIR33326.1 hypothetical protein YPPY12_2999 [Yersinia pestis PY-12]EIR73563.1 hypothetical protein YPPY29_2710 [Yersinia pestis PY-29]EIR75594.1 hypothetical protein YPPY34_2862 [Yersinia pestis PY-34]EIR89815.1 hypothetical protein YPPY42_2889 [Yersinia pestis PY-42]EIR91660.1 hypothetical protein YPPY45_2750 [Yersinia pestis PY-45]EIS31271.1 hypothetical protein YPPY56_2912 [Yersinia pestis PY-56]EIS55617.1 hypothetical protein YPP
MGKLLVVFLSCLCSSEHYLNGIFFGADFLSCLCGSELAIP